MQEELSKEDWEEWLNLPQTKQLFHVIREEQELGLQVLINQSDLDALHQARLVGVLAGLQKVLNYTYDDGKPS